MKLALKSLLVLSSLIAVAATASELPSPVSACQATLRLSAAQKGEIANLNAASAKEASLIIPEIEKARFQVRKLAVEMNATKEEAQAAQSVLREKREQLALVKESAKFAIEFDVLSAEQRVRKARCEQRVRPVVSRPQIEHQRPRPVIVHRSRYPRGPIFRRELPHRSRHHVQRRYERPRPRRNPRIDF